MASKEVLELKQQQVEEIKAKISSAKSIVIIDYMGLNVAEDTAFRKDLRNAGVEYQVLKTVLSNSLSMSSATPSSTKRSTAPRLLRSLPPTLSHPQESSLTTSRNSTR